MTVLSWAGWVVLIAAIAVAVAAAGRLHYLLLCGAGCGPNPALDRLVRILIGSLLVAIPAALVAAFVPH